MHCRNIVTPLLGNEVILFQLTQIRRFVYGSFDSFAWEENELFILETCTWIHMYKKLKNWLNFRCWFFLSNHYNLRLGWFLHFDWVWVLVFLDYKMRMNRIMKMPVFIPNLTLNLFCFFNYIHYYYLVLMIGIVKHIANILIIWFVFVI